MNKAVWDNITKEALYAELNSVYKAHDNTMPIENKRRGNEMIYYLKRQPIYKMINHIDGTTQYLKARGK